MGAYRVMRGGGHCRAKLASFMFGKDSLAMQGRLRATPKDRRRGQPPSRLFSNRQAETWMPVRAPSAHMTVRSADEGLAQD